MPIKVKVMNTRQTRLEVRVIRPKWQNYLMY